MKSTAKISSVLIVLFILLTAFLPNEKFLIVIDAGLGGNDTGATFKDIKEKEIVRKIARQIVDANHDPNVELIIIGEEDKFIDLDHRIRAINSLNPSVLISLHGNFANDVSRRGIEAYVSPKNKFYQQSKSIATDITRLFPANTANVFERDLRILQNVKCPAITLEVGYLSNEEDRNLLTSPEGQKYLGEVLYQSLTKR